MLPLIQPGVLLACITARAHCWLMFGLLSTTCYVLCLCVHMHVCACMYLYTRARNRCVSSSCHASLKRASLMCMCAHIYVCVYTHVRQIAPSAALSSSFSILSHAFQLSLVVTVDYPAFPNSSAVTHTLAGCASQPPCLPGALPWLCFSKLQCFKYLFEMYQVSRLRREWQWSETFPMRIELNPIWSNSNPERNNIGSVLSKCCLWVWVKWNISIQYF